MTGILLLGFLIGMRHALDADHVAAVASLVVSTSNKRNSIRQGVWWGIGHTLTLFTVGAFVIAADTALSPTIAAYLEICVGLMLLALGLDIAWKMIRKRVHFHVHRHLDGVKHFHAHSHHGEAEARHQDADSHRHAHSAPHPSRALFIGLMHGLAGSAALIILTVTSTLSTWDSLAYMALFGLGSIVGMALLSAVIAFPLSRSGRKLTMFHRSTQIAVSALNVSLGAVLIYQAVAA